MQGLDWSAIRRFASTGEASSPDDSHWLSARAGYKPVLEYIGGTEIGGSFLAGSMLQPQIPSTFSTPTLGQRTRRAVLRFGQGKCMQMLSCTWCWVATSWGWAVSVLEADASMAMPGAACRLQVSVHCIDHTTATDAVTSRCTAARLSYVPWLHQPSKVPVAPYGTVLRSRCVLLQLLGRRHADRFTNALIGRRAGTRIVLLKDTGKGDQSQQYHQSPHGGGEALVGELALVAPCLGWSQRLLNRDHHAAYYQVQHALMSHYTACVG